MYNIIWNGIKRDCYLFSPAHSAGFFVMGEKTCRFCQPDVNQKNHLVEMGLQRLDIFPLIETDKLALFPDVLPVEKTGLHFLIVPKTHAQAFAQRNDLMDELGYLIRRTEEEFGVPMIRGEHGGGDLALGYGENKVQSVYHQHLHLFGNPDGADILAYMKDALKKKEKIEYKQVHGLDGTPIPFLSQAYSGHPYLYIQQGSEGVWMEDKGDTFPSQILQRNMGMFFNGEVLNWKDIPRKPELARLSAQRIVEVFNKCKI